MTQRAEVVLSSEDREVLERWARRPNSAQALAFRCRIVLAAADGAEYCQRISDSGDWSSACGCTASS